MILVDVQVPSLDGIYDFELDEKMEVCEVVTQIFEMIALQENGVKEPGQEMFLYAIRKESILNPQKTLEQQGIQNGESLIVI